MRARGSAETTPVRLLLRHADAGVRADWGAADEWRGLSALGHVQAEEVVGRLGGMPFLRVLSSPSLRCRQTVVPLAWKLGVDVEPRRELAADADPGMLVRFLGDPETEAGVLCTHRESLETLFIELALSGTTVPGSGSPMEKAAAWLLLGVVGDRNGVRLRYLPARRRPWSVGPQSAVGQQCIDREQFVRARPGVRQREAAAGFDRPSQRDHPAVLDQRDRHRRSRRDDSGDGPGVADVQPATAGSLTGRRRSAAGS
jgi:phosphohistidine phosphatase SixA